jgi:hypothetical protein
LHLKYSTPYSNWESGERVVEEISELYRRLGWRGNLGGVESETGRKA